MNDPGSLMQEDHDAALGRAFDVGDEMDSRLALESRDAKTRAAHLRDQILKTWNPNQETAQIARTSVMQTLAYVFGREFLPELTYNQRCAIDQGLELCRQVLEPLG